MPSPALQGGASASSALSGGVSAALSALVGGLCGSAWPTSDGGATAASKDALRSRASLGTERNACAALTGGVSAPSALSGEVSAAPSALSG